MRIISLIVVVLALFIAACGGDKPSMSPTRETVQLKAEGGTVRLQTASQTAPSRERGRIRSRMARRSGNGAVLLNLSTSTPNSRPAKPYPWDINGDGEVNIFDLTLLGKSYGKDITDKTRSCDVNGDGRIDIFDLALVGRHYGEKITYPKAKIVLRRGKKTLYDEDLGLTPQKLKLYTGEEILIDGSGSKGDLVDFKWDVDGDGAVDSHDPTLTRKLTKVGRDTISLEVVDKNGFADRKELELEVLDGTPVINKLSWKAEGVTLPVKVELSAQVSDPDDNLLNVAWDIDGDGKADYTGIKVEAAFDKYGKQKVIATVKDPHGLSSSKSLEFELKGSAPKIELSIEGIKEEMYTPYTLTLVPKVVDSGSGKIKEVRFDFEGDGKIDLVSKEVKPVEHEYRKAGKLSPTIIVSNSSGLESKISKEIELKDGSPQVLGIYIGPKEIAPP
ncbi:hypothetical protein J7M22_18295 [Candidatus Poribacteria bacterium]|nr:hypothetical protein [Candidatus Poribacteria bacterium]